MFEKCATCVSRFGCNASTGVPRIVNYDEQVEMLDEATGGRVARMSFSTRTSFSLTLDSSSRASNVRADRVRSGPCDVQEMGE